MAGKKGMKSGRVTKASELSQFKAGWLGDIDRRTALYRALSERLRELYADLGGAKNLTVQQRVLCERAVFLEFQLRDMETHALDGEMEIDLGRYGFLSNVLSGLLRTLGLERKRDAAGGDMALAWAAALEEDSDSTRGYPRDEVLKITHEPK